MERTLEFEVLRRNRPEGRFDAQADVENVNQLRGIFQNWLEGKGWDRGLWVEFEAVVRFSGEGTVRKKVRAR